MIGKKTVTIAPSDDGIESIAWIYNSFSQW